MSDELPPYDSFLLVSFGGPEGPDEVMPFLENVLRGKRVPRERMLEVAEHYKQFGGVSPINGQNRELLTAIEQEFKNTGVDLPIYWGNRNWDPMLPDTLRQMRDDGCQRTLAFFTSMFSCYSGCRQYREDIAKAQAEVGEGAPIVEKVRMGFNHPGFIGSVSEAVREAMQSLPSTSGNDQQTSATKQDSDTTVLFTAHSIPLSMSENCDYVKQLNESCRLVAEACGVKHWQLVYQSRSGPPQQPWLEPDICDTIAKMHDEEGLSSLVVCPIGFISDHMEVMFDLDEEAAQACGERGIAFARAATAGTATSFVGMIRELVEERMGRHDTKSALGQLGPWHDVCPTDCCLYTPRRP
ncbi:MAG: ferrochelatase [Rubripirellula sp.]|nr:ferrochelatase [Rubripirellula sp.]